jgi:hypothetical protein
VQSSLSLTALNPGQLFDPNSFEKYQIEKSKGYITINIAKDMSLHQFHESLSTSNNIKVIIS